MKKVLIILTLIFSTTFFNVSAANVSYDHDSLMEYEGYGEAMYESIVRETTFITGQYTDNKEYVSQSIDQISDYAKFWAKEQSDLNASCGGADLFSKNCLRDLVEVGGGYALTVGDWVKKLFTGYKDDVANDEDDIDYSSLYPAFDVSTGGMLIVKSGYYVKLYYNNEYLRITPGRSFGRGFKGSSGQPYYYYYDLFNSNSYVDLGDKRKYVDTKEEYNNIRDTSIAKSVGQAISNVNSLTGVRFEVYDAIDQLVVPIYSHGGASKLANYLKDNPSKNMQIPQPQPSLVCPGGERIVLTVDGATFLNTDGSIMLVNKDGTATVSGSTCNLKWDVPKMEYVNDKPAIQKPNGDLVDMETGDVLQKGDGTDPDNPDDGDFELEEGCGVVCAVGKVLSGLGSIAKAIAGLVKSLLDGILALFVPKDLNFVTEEFNRITDALNKKIAVTDDLKKSLLGLFEGGGSNPLNDISFSLVDGPTISFAELDFLDTGVVTIKRIISAIVFLYTIIYVYRKIVGRGGVMEK